MGRRYLRRHGLLLTDMQKPREVRRAWAALGAAEKQRRLARWRLAQQRQVARDARVLPLVRSD